VQNSQRAIHRRERRQSAEERTYGTERKDGEDRPKRTTGLVDVGEHARRVAGFRESSQDSGARVDATETDGEDRDANGDVTGARRGGLVAFRRKLRTSGRT
jgi:hypothetical protein